MSDHLIWGGCDTVRLAHEYGTPLYGCPISCKNKLTGIFLFVGNVLYQPVIHRIYYLIIAAITHFKR